MLLITTEAFNNSDFIRYQYQLISKFCLNSEWKYIVYVCAIHPAQRADIINVCEELKIPHKEIPSRPGESPSDNCAFNINYQLTDIISDSQILDTDIHLHIDSDLFPIKPFEITLTGNVEFCYLENTREHIDYCWNGYFYGVVSFLRRNAQLMNFRSEFYCGRIGTDAGGFTHFLLAMNRGCVDKVSLLSSGKWNFETNPGLFNDNQTITFFENDRKLNNKFYSELLDNNRWFHYRAGSNWENLSPDFHFRRWERVALWFDFLLL